MKDSTVILLALSVALLIHTLCPDDEDEGKKRNRKVHFGKNEIKYYILTSEEKEMKKQSYK